MEFVLKFYVGSGKSSARYVGSSILSDEHTLQHYETFSRMNGAVYSIWFNSVIADKPHGNAFINSSALIVPFQSPNEKGLLYILPANSYSFLTQTEWNNEEGVNSLIANLNIEDLSRFL